MDSYSFYKSLYDRELVRRMDLDRSINTPMTVLILVIGLNSVYVNKHFISNLFLDFGAIKLIFILINISVLVSVFFLVRSYNNLFKGFAYRNLALSGEIRNFELNVLPEYNAKADKHNVRSFEILLIERINLVTDNHTIFNDKRGLDLYRAKTSIIILLILTAIQMILLTFN